MLVIEANMVVEHNDELSFEESLNFLFAFAMILTFTFDKIHVELACMSRREIAIYRQVFVIEAHELSLEGDQIVLLSLNDRHKFSLSLGRILIQTKFSLRAYMARHYDPIPVDCAILSCSPCTFPES